jgi:hypothetical protein
VTYVDLYIKGSIADDPGKLLEFKLEKDVPGTNTIYYLYAMHNGEFDSDQSGSDLITNVTANANRNIKGTFHGILTNVDNTANINITSGSFDITY